jgi:O-antigen/teichoic acid export membrane protein
MTLGQLKRFLTGSHQRSIKIQKNVAGIFCAKVVGIGASFLMVPLVLNYLEPNKYGIWIALSSVIGWFGFFDIGLSNGLRNSMGKALAQKDIPLAKSLVSTTMGMLIGIVLILTFIYLLINSHIDWTSIFNSPTNFRYELEIVVGIVFSFFAIRFLFGLILTVLAIYQRPAIVEFLNATITILSLISIWLLTKYTDNSLIYLGAALGGSAALVLFVANVWFFKHEYKEIAPDIKSFDRKKINSLTNQGVQFFIIQIAGMVLFTTDNIIIIQIFGPENVAPYSISFKMFSIGMIGFGVLMAPLWASLNEAYVQKEFSWINKSMKNILALWILLVGGMGVALIFSSYIYEIWIGDKVRIPFILSALMALYVIIHTFISIYVTFIFAAGKIKLQVYLAVFAAIFNIPLSYLFAKYFELGPAGVILATILCIAPNIILSPIQYIKIINGKDQGIWGA